ncbi:biotin-dependent carboxyltransferase family protein [Bacillus sp. PK3_68]|uniref:5-oxoprolinase subunit C family protein n=1 Tax=Bacillus sp. PK3_68 TaxID=2027408 RepID=UPI000E75B0E0|nr:biotin-dependent carboxyltransferase family protein [Bacillus sp. PK3_68]RJS50159.1 hydrolase [Bacillus sp. PK3_68]
MLRIIEAGNTTVQDLGRYGNYHYGIPRSGAADKYSFMAGNLLLNNPMDSAGLEMTFFGPKILFERETVICITGAPMTAYKNNQLIPMWENVKMCEGDILHFSPSNQGVKTYLCVSGGIQVPKVLGSRSTYLNSQFGGFQGRGLSVGDCIPIGEPPPEVFKRVGKSIPHSYLPNFQKHSELRVVMGLSAGLISDDGIKSFLNSEWKVSNESNRVAYRYTGSSVKFQTFKAPFGAGDSSSNVVDIPYPVGVVMVPNEEEVIVMLHDGTTGGGFVTIGTVISPDLDLIAQSRPTETSRFLAVSMNEAIEARKIRQKKIAELAESCK